MESFGSSVSFKSLKYFIHNPFRPPFLILQPDLKTFHVPTRLPAGIPEDVLHTVFFQERLRIDGHAFACFLDQRVFVFASSGIDVTGIGIVDEYGFLLDSPFQWRERQFR